MNQREVIITEVTGSTCNNLKTSTIKHVQGCTGDTHRILARLVDVQPKELSKVQLNDRIHYKLNSVSYCYFFC